MRIMWCATLLATLWCLGCATLSPRASQIHEVDTSQLADCRDLGLVEGDSGGGSFSNRPLAERIAHNEALEHAAEKGATHVRWLEDYPNWGARRVTAEAYACN